MSFRLTGLAYCLPLAMLLAAACDAGNTSPTGGGGGDLSPTRDQDGDGISDADEGDDDADGDGVPNYLDKDSDGDGIPDSLEAGDDDLATPPVDSDNDGTPDFLDLDSDGNGIPDAEEGLEDFDGDGIPDFQDGDDDNDFLPDTLEIEGAGCPTGGGSASDPTDCDGDGNPDHQDFDSDGDTISDFHESTNDTDSDGIPDRYDIDSDNDGFLDSVEAGDSDLSTPPVDTDDDGIPDFRDLDSDSDGLSDADEYELGTDPTDIDTDGDGVSDLIENVAGTDPLDANDNPQANGDFVFIIPYQEPTTPPQDTVRFRTNIQFADVYFGFDTTGSMSEELNAMKNVSTGLPYVLTQLECADYGGSCNLDDDCNAGVCFEGHCIQDPNQGVGCIPDVWTGLGTWNDLNTYRNIISLQPNPSVTAGAIPGTGGGASEAPFQPPHCISNPNLCPAALNMACSASGVGCPGFRPQAIRIYIQITDANQQCSGTACPNFTAATAGAALQAADIKFIGLWGTGDQTGTGTAQSVATDIAIASGTLNAMGQPFVYQAIDAAVVSNTINAIQELARGKALYTTITASDAVDGPSDVVDATQFIEYLEINASGVNNCEVVTPTEDTDGNTFHDTFPVLYPGKKVCWDVHPVAVNTTVPATDEPQIYRAILTVTGDGSPLDERDVYFLIPPDNVIITPR